MHINIINLVFFYSEKISYFFTSEIVRNFSSEIIRYFFTVAKQGFLCNFGTGTFFKMFKLNLSEGYLSEITLRIL